MPKKKKVSPLDIEFDGTPRIEMRDQWSGELKQFYAEAIELFQQGKLPTVTNRGLFARFMQQAIRSEFPSDRVPSLYTLAKYATNDLAKA